MKTLKQTQKQVLMSALLGFTLGSCGQSVDRSGGYPVANAGDSTPQAPATPPATPPVGQPKPPSKPYCDIDCLAEKIYEILYPGIEGYVVEYIDNNIPSQQRGVVKLIIKKMTEDLTWKISYQLAEHLRDKGKDDVIEKIVNDQVTTDDLLELVVLYLGGKTLWDDLQIIFDFIDAFKP